MKPPAYLRKRATLGASWLDENEPGWRDRIAPADLDMVSCHLCVFGQVFATTKDGSRRNGYETGLLRATRLPRGDEVGHAWAVRHGFTLSNADIERDPDGFDRLRDAWVAVIKGNEDT